VSDGVHYAGMDGAGLAARLGLPRVVVHDTVESTMDEAHLLAANGAPAGTLVLADAQTRGRGRGGRHWSSEGGQGIWMTLLERPADATAVEVLSLRMGLRAARALDRFVEGRLLVKWPNDLLIGEGKLAGILVEARWRDARPEWVAIGIGINVRPPAGIDAASLVRGCDRLEVLGDLVPALRAGATRRGALDEDELREWDGRDWARGRHAVMPREGIVRGVNARGALLVETLHGLESCASGSLVLDGVAT
jgi:BirA family transcriptional regulator, biotin operon repressor / biotin---[acetyl-CoA-carboxylase] ligase